MIIELFGSPGAGKTYAINQLHPGAIKENKSAKDRVLDAFKRVVKFAILFHPYAFKVRRTIRSCLAGEKIEQTKYKPVYISDFIRNISMLCMVYKLSRGDIYMDEGIVHRTISMCINYGIRKEVCRKTIQELQFALNSVRVVFLDISKEDCLKSIESRNRHIHSIDELSGKRLDEFISAYDTYCHYIRDSFGFERVTRDSVCSLKL